MNQCLKVLCSNHNSLTSEDFLSNPQIYFSNFPYVYMFNTRLQLHIPAFLPLTLTLGLRSYKMPPHYPLHHVTYAPAKFEVATSNGLRGDAFTRKTLFDHEVKVLTMRSRLHEMLPSTLYIM